MSPEERLRELGLELPKMAAPVAKYVPFKRAGNLVFVSGQIPVSAGELAFKGAVGRDLSIEDGQAAARLCALNILAVAKAAAGDLAKVEILRLEGFVASAPGFTDQAQVVNGASELLAKILGETGVHARFAVGVSELPLGAPVEISAVLALTQ